MAWAAGAAAALAPATVGAWGAEGHRLVAEVATAQLSPAAHAEADRLLVLEPGATLASVANWADEARTPTTAPWHFINFPRDAACRYDADRMCLQGTCVTGAIERQVAVLGSKAPGERRLHALKYLVHLVGDVHQPLHAGYADDKGGNGYQVQAFGRGTNLHALWDSGLITNWPGGSQALRAAVLALPQPAADIVSTQAWAEQSCRVVSAAGFYPDGHELPSDYPALWSSTLTQQLAAAGYRLGVLLESALLSGAPR